MKCCASRRDRHARKRAEGTRDQTVILRRFFHESGNCVARNNASRRLRSGNRRPRRQNVCWPQRNYICRHPSQDDLNYRESRKTRHHEEGDAAHDAPNQCPHDAVVIAGHGTFGADVANTIGQAIVIEESIGVVVGSGRVAVFVGNAAPIVLAIVQRRGWRRLR
jgi:hypothetical protein